MANNRMFLVHVPSGLGVHLGKRMARGWYTGAVLEPDLTGRLNRFYEMIELRPEWDQDAFALALEDGEALPMPTWTYGPMEGEFRRFFWTHRWTQENISR
jgi:hypothetical protein